MPGPSEKSAEQTTSGLAGQGEVTAAVRAQLLSTEHWSLNASRTLTWNETFSRATLFFNVVSASVVALALVAQQTNLGENFRLFAIPLLIAVLLVGLGTFIRLLDAEQADWWLLAGMNRLRHAYLDLAPDLEPYLVAGHHDDRKNVEATGQSGAGWSPIQIFATTPALVAAVNAVIAGSLAGLIAGALHATTAIAIAAGVVAGLVVIGSATIVFRQTYARFWRHYEPRFPS